MSIRIQEEDFNHSDEYQKLCKDSPQIGAVVTFCGLVREFDKGKGKHLLIEHFPNMTEKVLSEIIQQAKQNWPIFNVHIIHRIGTLTLGEQIVFIGVNSPHRDAAFKACEFIIDYLKTKAPFWKKAINSESEYWIEVKDSDKQAQERWNK